MAKFKNICIRQAMKMQVPNNNRVFPALTTVFVIISGSEKGIKEICLC